MLDDKLNKLRLFLYSFLFLLFITFLLSYLGNIIGGDEAFVNDTIQGKYLTVDFLAIVVVGPILEVFIFQFIIIELIFLIKIRNIKYVAITLSALLFALTHFYNFIYFISALIMGVGFAFCYTIFRKYGVKFSFWGIALIHILINFISFLLNDVFGIDI